jgi:RNA polymerase sigma-70 factor (ECF subfamily)
MLKKKILVSAIALVAVVLLFNLPKVVVKDEERDEELESISSASEGATDRRRRPIIRFREATALVPTKRGGNARLGRITAMSRFSSPSRQSMRAPHDAAVERSANGGMARAAAASAAVEPRNELVAFAFASLQPTLLRYLRGLLAAREDAEDIAKETYLKLAAIPEPDLEFGTLRALVFKIATNLAYDRFRARRVRGATSDAELDEVASDAPSLEHIVDFEQGLALIKRTLLELEPRCRQVFLMRAHVGLDYEDIAAQLGISKRTVEREMAHALEACQQRLRGNAR